MKLIFYSILFIAPCFCIAQNQFAPQILSFSQFPQGQLNWVDLDRDGDLDVITRPPSQFAMYENVNNEFILRETPFIGSTINPTSYSLSDYDNDNDVDLLLVDFQDLIIAKNVGNFSFELITTPMKGTSYPPKVHWVDINGDVMRDLVIDELIFINRNGNYELSDINLPNFVSNQQWADLNNDGLLDFIGTKGTTSNSNPLYVYLNSGEGIFIEGSLLATQFPDNYTLNLIDFDNDLDLDLFLPLPGEVKLLKNLFSESGVVSFGEMHSIRKFNSARIAVGDINADNLPDIVLHGSSGFDTFSTIAFLNNSTSGLVEFTERNLEIESVHPMHFELIDLDRDGDLDISFSGVTDVNTYSYQVRLYKNTQGQLPPVPIKPSNLISSVKRFIELTWDSPERYPNYNIELTRNGTPVKSPLALANGTSLWPGQLRHSSSKTIQLYNLPAGSYEWSVQSVNHARRNSEFSPKMSFTIKESPTNLSLEKIDLTEIKLAWEFEDPLATAFAIYRKSNDSPFVELGVVPANEKSFTDIDIPVNKNHEYVVKAVFGDEYSAPSNSIYYFSGLFNEEAFDPAIANIIESVAVSADFDSDLDYDLGIIGRIDFQFGNALILKNNGMGAFSSSAFIPNHNEPYSNMIRNKDIDNDGDTDIIIVYGSQYSWNKVIVFKNHQGLFTSTFETQQLLGITQLEVEDINQDGRQDLIYSHVLGNNSGNPRAFEILFQNESGEFLDSGIKTTSTDNQSYYQIKISDLNNDGFKDLFMFGGSPKPILFINQGGNAFKQASTETFPLLGEPFFYDFDGDGKTDIVQGGNANLEFYRGLGDLRFAEPLSYSLKDIGYTQPIEILVADLDLNGMPDFLVKDDYRVGILQGRQDGKFVLSDYTFASDVATKIQLTNLDNDQDIDIVKLGTNGSHEGKHYFYRNQISSARKVNTLPSKPLAAEVEHTNHGTKFSWLASTDSETPQAFLSYNLHIVDSNGKVWLHSETNPDKTYRYRLATGNAGHKTNFTINNLPAGTYTVAVQSVDASFALSEPGPTTTFTIAPGPENLSIERLLLNKIKLSWTPPVSGGATFIVERKSEYSNFEKIAELPSTALEFIDENLPYNEKFTYRVYGLVGDTYTAHSNWINWNTALFIVKESVHPNVYGSIDVGDFNKDGKMDFIVNGGRIYNGSYTERISELFENTNNGFVNQSVGSTSQIGSPLKFFDFDGDGYLDIYQQGYVTSLGQYQTELFRNNGNKTFSTIENSITNNDYQILSSWDYDRDNDWDLVAASSINFGLQHVLVNKEGVFEVDPSQDLTCTNCLTNNLIADFNKDGMEDVWRPESGGYKLFLNSSSGLFEANLETQFFYGSTLRVIDYDGDGWNDIISVSTDFIQGGRVYKNLGYDESNKKYLGFKVVINDLPYNATTIPCDFDHDGDMDIFASSVSKLYINEGNDSFKGLRILGVDGMTNSNLIDIDSDGDLDVLIMGYFNNFTSEEVTKAKVLENQLVVSGRGLSNLPPEKPFDLSARQDENGMHLMWKSGLDDHTPPESQSFDIVIYRNGKSLTKMPIDGMTGIRMRLAPGCITSPSFTLDNLAPGEYSWRVQAVDQSFSGSELSSFGSFLLRPKVPSGIKDTIIYSCGRQLSLSASGQNIEWFSDPDATVKIASGPIFYPLTSQTVYLTQTVGGIQSIVKKIEITIKAQPDPPIVKFPVIVYCESNSPNDYQFITADGQNLKWYSDQGKTSLIKEGEYLQIFATEKSYYVTQTIDNCESSPTQISVQSLLIDSQIYLEEGKLRVKDEGADRYIWFKDNELLVDQNHFILDLDLDEGSYAVVIYKGPCVEVSPVFKVTGVEDKSTNVSLYPNPASHKLLVQLNDGYINNIYITDMSGRVVISKQLNNLINKNIEIDVSSLSDGVYFVRFENESEVTITKLIIKRGY